MTVEQQPYDKVHYNPVSVRDSVGTIVLGVVSLALLVALLRAQSENRRLLAAQYRADTPPGD